MNTINLHIENKDTSTDEVILGICENEITSKNVALYQILEANNISTSQRNMAHSKVDTNCCIELKVIQSISIADELFILDRKENLFCISHNNWSLTGEGKTLLEAEQDLITKAHEVSEFYINENPSKLTIQALQFRDFLFRILP